MTYDDCDKQFIQRFLEKNCPNGFVPIWATENRSEVTKHADVRAKFEYVFADVLTGTKKSDCPAPCLSTMITSVFIDEKIVMSNNSRIDIAFYENVYTTDHDFPIFSLAQFLASLGGTLGLWLGLGVIQTLNLILNWLLESGDINL